MKATIITMLCLALLVSLSADLSARKAVIRAEKMQAVLSPTDARDTRVLLSFDLPKEVSDARVSVDFATLSFKAQITDADLGQIDVFPVTAEWKGSAAASCESSRGKGGVKFSEEYDQSFTSLPSEAGMKEISIDVTEIVRAWQKGALANHGLVVKLSSDDLANLPVKVSFGGDAAELQILYSSERTSK